ncbi:MAG: hypothetical protein FGM41_08275, partial [Bacteroidetes bacterium]|nr:hypothetical protein [Bacteroidota bacterium]
MKKLSLPILMFFCLALKVFAQNPIPHKYKLGEGYTFSDKEKSSFDLNGYIQPSMEIRSYPEDSIHDSYTRFRIRRLRLRV